ncbi:MAG TPA: acyl-CoA dehydrogenase family protein [Micromonospora sp.]
MDFSLSPEMEALRDLASGILADSSTPDHLTELDKRGEWLDRQTWTSFADSGVVGAALPESVGGAGLGFLELYQVLERVGAAVAQIPLWESVVCGALPIARHGSPELIGELLPGVVTGESLLTAALLEPGAADPRQPRTTATRTGEGWRISGVKTQVPLAQLADWILVSAVTEDERSVIVVVRPSAAGVTIEPQKSVSQRPLARVTFDDVAADAVLAEPDDGAVLDDVLLHAMTGLAAMQAGVCAEALRRAAEYTSGRKQFGRPIATFQAVRQRLADSYIDVEAIRLTSLQAAWQLSEGMDAHRAVEIAKFWAAEGGHRVLYAAQHVHGGIGIDLDYPLHRYFRFGKYIEFTLGPAKEQLRRLGRRFAAQP